MLNARDLMEAVTHVIPADSTVERALGVMRNRTLRDAPVVDRTGQIVGVVGLAQLERVRRESVVARQREQVLDWELLPAGGGLETKRVGSMPCRKCIVIDPEETLGGLAQRMRERGVTMAVVRRSHKVIGLLRLDAVLRGLEEYERDLGSR